MHLRIPIIFLIVILSVVIIYAQSFPDKKNHHAFYKAADFHRGRTLINAGNWSYWIYNTGTSGNDPNGDPGGIYPRGTAGLIFTDGLIWGGYVRDTISQNPRTGGVAYQEGVQQGWITGNGNGLSWESAIPVNPNNPRAAVWRIRTDYKKMPESDLRKDAAELNLKEPDKVTDEEMQDVYDQYDHDWNNWPVDLGAPFYDINHDGVYTPGLEIDLDGNGLITTGEREEPGCAGADQVVWCVYNDLNIGKTVALYGSQPMGLEEQVTTWVYAQPASPAGQLIFRRYLLINISGTRMDSMYVCQWADVDIGNYTDDLAGCDSIAGLGSGYSAYNTDFDYLKFGLPPASVGYLFLQGPIISGKSGQDLNNNNIDDLAEYARMAGSIRGPGQLNLPMTSFNWFKPTSMEPCEYSYECTLEMYNAMRGFLMTGNLNQPTYYTVGAGPKAGQITKFPLDGDPVLQNGDIDGLGANYPPGDRRIGLSSGPFTFAPGDSQEIIVAIAGGIVNQPGGNNLNAISRMRFNTDYARYIYDHQFKYIPRAPAPPHVVATPLENKIILEWGSDLEQVALTEADLPFRFEGYNIYQLPSKNATADQAVKIATYDAVNGIRLIEGTRYVPELKYFVTYPIQEGSDSGIKRHIEIDKDYLTGGRLFTGTPYYYSVTAYNYTNDPDLPEPSIESSLLPAIEVIPQSPPPGVRYGGEYAQELEITHISGKGEGKVSVQVIDPAATTGSRYEIYFTPGDTALPSTGKIYWNLRNLDLNTDVLTGQMQTHAGPNRDDQPIIDGLKVLISIPDTTFTSFQVTANSNGILDPPEIGCFAFSSNGFPRLYNSYYPYGSDRPDGSRQQPTNGGAWGIHTAMTPDNDGRFDYFISRTTADGQLWPEIIPCDWEIRFTYPSDAWALEPAAFSGGSNQLIQVPFELWNTGANTPDDLSDDIRMFPLILDLNKNGVFDLNPVDHWVSGGDNDPETDWFYWVLTEDNTPGINGYLSLLNKIQADVAGYSYPDGAKGEIMQHMVLVNWNGGSVNDPTFPANLYAVMPEKGTVFRIITSKPHTPADRYEFTAPAAAYKPAIAQADAKKINVFPNPYMAVHANEPDRFTRFVTFTHLPQKATIRIFNLAGLQVRKLEKNTPDQFFRWDLRNESNYDVASGLYIVLIDLPALGRQRILKLMIIQPREWLKYF